MPHPVALAVQRALAEGVLPRDQLLLVALSGGPDSVALTLALAAEQLPLVAAHFNHRLRGAASDEDAAWVEAFAAARGLRLVIGHDDLPSPTRNWEAVARQRRYRFLGAVARAEGASAIVVAHTRDDQLETFLLRLLRGAGPAGLAGMAPVSRLDQLTGVAVPVVRPLLETPRAATLDYCRQAGVTPRHDRSNDSPRFLRNRLRHHVLPLLQRENPRLAEEVATLTTLLRDQQQIIREEVQRRWNEVALPGEVALRREVLRRWPRALASEAVRLAVAPLLASPSPLTSRHLQAVLALVARERPGRLQLPAGLEAVTDQEALRLQRRRVPQVPLPVTLTAPGEAAFGGWRLRAERRVATAVRETSSPTSVWLHSEGPFLVRSRAPGDRYRPLGRSGSVTLQDELVNRKVPREERPRVPVVTVGERIVWVVGSRIAESERVREGEMATWLQAERLPSCCQRADLLQSG